MNLTDIQTVSLEILNIIDEFCNNHGICYSLGYGSLIGAIRHKGCIPWDDDIDIIMSRENYNKFIHLFNDYKGYKLFAPELYNCYHVIARVCDIRKTRVLKYYKWCDEETGVWVDIFPYDDIPFDGGEEIRKAADSCYLACMAHAGLSPRFPLRQNLSNIKNFLLRGNMNRNKTIQYYLDTIKQSICGSSLIRNYGSPYNKKDIHSRMIFDHYLRVPFGNQEVCVIKSYHEYLTNLYGDYMLLPPAEKQVRGHNKNKYYWIYN